MKPKTECSVEDNVTNLAAQASAFCYLLLLPSLYFSFLPRLYAFFSLHSTDHLYPPIVSFLPGSSLLVSGQGRPWGQKFQLEQENDWPVSTLLQVEI